MLTDIIGWTSTLILLLTISRQVYTQWRTRSVAGVSRWLFIGQLLASIGFLVYSVLLENWVFVFSNAFLVLAALIGQYVYMVNKRHAGKDGNAAGS